MKRTLSKFILFLFAISIIGCNNDNDLLLETEADNPSYQIIHKDFDFIKDNKVLLEKLTAISKDNNKEKGVKSRKDSDDFTIFTDRVTYVNSLADSTHSYTFYIERISGNEENTIENLILSSDREGQYRAYTAKYFFPDGITTDNNDFEVKSFKEIPIGDLSNLLGRGGGECDNVQYVIIETLHECYSGTHSGNEDINACDGNGSLPYSTFSISFVCNGGGGSGTGAGSGAPGDGGPGNDNGGGGTGTPPGGPGTDTGITLPPSCQTGDCDDESILPNRVNSLLDNELTDRELIWLFNNSDRAEEIVAFLRDNRGSEGAKREVRLTLATLSFNVSWNINPGTYNNVSSLDYTHTRNIYINGELLTQFKLASGDYLSLGNYRLCDGCSESEDRLYYYSKETKFWYEIPNPSNYNPLTLDFLWEGFWDSVLTGVRYCTPLEDVVILLDGKDFEGNEQSRAVAAAFILVDIIPGTKLVKGIKLIKYGDEVVKATEVVIKAADEIFKKQKEIVNGVINGVWVFDLDEFGNSIRKGNFGEMSTDVDLYGKGYDPLHVRATDIDDSSVLSGGIDGIFRNPKTGEFIIVESKYNTSTLSTLADGTPQMSDDWIEGGTRLVDAVGQNLADEILDAGYTRVLSQVTPDGDITYHALNAIGEITGAWTP